MTKPKGQSVKKWSTKKVGQIGFWTGRGRSSREIAEILGDGTHPATIRAVWYRWALPRRSKAQKAVYVTIPMSYAQRHRINKRAMRLGLAPERFILDVAYRAAQDDLYHAIVDGD
ncbi:hypothetical protein [Brucella microti]|uniref:hypothetical protein n=1 Tax=Brucella microti TaxID=444163 RepID=UPI0005A0BE32|nr:hypothetical protein [Brucella microti]